jgi:hypothetical protein
MPGFPARLGVNGAIQSQASSRTVRYRNTSERKTCGVEASSVGKAPRAQAMRPCRYNPAHRKPYGDRACAGRLARMIDRGRSQNKSAPTTHELPQQRDPNAGAMRGGSLRRAYLGCRASALWPKEPIPEITSGCPSGAANARAYRRTPSTDSSQRGASSRADSAAA